MKIEEIFKDFKFEGKGREQKDLDRIMHKLEHWVHLMHPRYPFGQTLERIEFLGIKKKPIKTYLKKIRMGLISSVEKEDDFLNLDQGSSDDETHASTAHEDGTQEEHVQNQVPDDLDLDTIGVEPDDEFPDDFPTLPIEIEEAMD